MPTAEIITIGTEILLGEIQDTNSRYIAGELRENGVDLFRITIVGDNVWRIARAIQEALERAEIVITTGGLGPTVDDPTREAFALAFGVSTEFRPELWEQIQNRFRRFGRPPTENNKRQAHVPAGAVAIENPVGTAPAFAMKQGEKSVIALPGVPREMEYLMEHAVMPYIKQNYAIVSVIKSRLLHTAGAGESQIDDLIGDLELQSNPTVGLAAHAGQVDVRIAAKAASAEAARAMIEEVEAIVRERLGEWIYGADAETLEEAAYKNLSAHGWKLGVLEAGLGGVLIQRLGNAAEAQAIGKPKEPEAGLFLENSFAEYMFADHARDGGVFARGEMLTTLPAAEALTSLARSFRLEWGIEAVLAAALYPAGEKQDIFMAVITPDGEKEISRSYGGPPTMAAAWAVTTCLNLLRKI